MKYLALIPNYYGFGKSADEAKKALRRACHRTVKASDIAMYEVSDDYWIDDFGTAHGAQPAKYLSGPDYRS